MPIIEGDGTQDSQHLATLNDMYKDYFLDYASYVILERAVPAIGDGLKPVQRRILFSLRQMDDGRYHKVANVIGQTMQYHPHGDAAIGDALVNMGQKDLLIDCQGNWGDIRTGDGAAAARYIEARLTKFALEVLFNSQTTEWQVTYDGRKNEPITLPAKFPLLLAQGAEGIAVGLSTKILPHNFIELIDACIAALRGKDFQIFPDFQTGGLIDVTNYNEGRRGGRVRVRARIEVLDKKTLIIKELPFGVTTGALIESILKANDKGQIKIKKVTDNTAKDVEIQLELQPGIAPEQTIDALFAFTACESPISPNACVIIDDKPHFLSVDEILRVNAENTQELLRQELLIAESELLEKWFFANLEKIFIENRIYREIEEAESWEQTIEIIDRNMRLYVATPEDYKGEKDTRIHLHRNLTRDDIVRLTEIKIKRISKYNSFKADEEIDQLNKDLDEVRHHLAHLTDYAVAYFKRLKEKYGKGKERKTEITPFETIQATQVVANNAKLYADFEGGFVGFGMKKDTFITDCSDIDDIIAFRKDGKFIVSRIGEKVFLGKDLIYVAVWNKNDERTTYNMIYLDGESGTAYGKRFNVTGITRDKEYDLTKGTKGSRSLYFSVQPNGESEILTITLSPASKAKIKVFDFDFSNIAIKGRSSQGNIVTKYGVRKVAQKSLGKSTLGARQYYIDELNGRLNTDGKGIRLGHLDTGDSILCIYNDGNYELVEFDQNRKFNLAQITAVAKFVPELIVSAVYYDNSKHVTFVKRFHIETTTINQKFCFISETEGSKLLFASLKSNPRIQYAIKVQGKKMDGELNINEFIDVKGWKSQGNKLSDHTLIQVKEIEVEPPVEAPDTLKAGDTIEFDIDGQGTLF